MKEDIQGWIDLSVQHPGYVPFIFSNSYTQRPCCKIFVHHKTDNIVLQNFSSFLVITPVFHIQNLPYNFFTAKIYGKSQFLD